MPSATGPSPAGIAGFVELACRACGRPSTMPRIEIREMMFGTREPFEYGHCPSCGSLSIAAIPQDLGRHYPDRYYATRGGPATRQDGRLARWSIRAQVRNRYFGDRTAWLPLARRLAKVPTDVRTLEALLGHGALRSVGAAIADVGCTASPNRLAILRRLGFTDLTGVEPYVDHDLVYQGVPVRRGELRDIDRTFDLVMFHHSLEHIADPVAALVDARDRLHDGGRVLVRTPIMGGHHWKTYGPDWVELDAPRHLVVFTMDGLTAAAGAAGLAVDGVTWESGAWESIASDQYRRDVAMYEPGSWFVDRASSGYDAERVRDFRALAGTLAGTPDAGRAAVWLRREATP